ncbi:predicted protein [Lichtheimia corymbifera JMRC:FSU:9682]|uniref:Uncharacterized protein n=1 Tax=Lichtheimia corymbifera JMRC:FSU:9682 TaxID=1263082 RepID=A0A068SDB3_9FUNG|nr:predicted protein [Lichtheimia corymbifera JMRC:FSU:9682]
MGNQPSHFDYSPPTTFTSYNHPATTTAGGGAGMSPYSRHGQHWIPPPSHPNGMSRQPHGWYQSSSYYSPAAASYSNAAAPPPTMMASNPGAAAAGGYPYYSNQYMAAHGYHHQPHPHHPVRYVYD